MKIATRIKYFHNFWGIVLASLLLYFLLLPSPLRLRKNLSIEAPSLPTDAICEMRPNSIEDQDSCKKRSKNIEDAKVKSSVIGYQLNTTLVEEGPHAKLLLAQLEKSNKEIQSRIDKKYSWFQIKYYLVGGLLIGFITKTFLSYKDEEQVNGEKEGKNRQVVNQLIRVTESPATVIILSFSLMIAIIVDAQILRENQVILQQGIWISHYVEKAFFPNLSIASWEEFLRIPGAYHHTIIGSIFSGSNIYIITIVLYAIYLFIFKKTIKKTKKNSDSGSNKPILSKKKLILPQEELIFTFWLLQGVILFSSITIHIAPESYDVTPFPLLTGWSQIYSNSLITVPIYFLVWLFFALFSLRITNFHLDSSINQ